MLERAELLKHLVLLGEQARVLPHVPLSCWYSTAAMPSFRSPPAPTACAVPPLVHWSPPGDTLVDLFDASWQQATPVSCNGPRRRMTIPT
ncbi:hypothetical protein [Streptomyces sp. NRRL S-1824]|uniref:hypothetical protein n=1 Tax=Streptomyces sp. NRRL S-1824 TaxID=1463889 RepID=UPI001F21F51A|nr:hypothetical protein [Streptomyces sp. NRRL S-1824]